MITFKKFLDIVNSGTYDYHEWRTEIDPKRGLDIFESHLSLLVRLVCEFDPSNGVDRRNIGFKLRSLRKILLGQISDGTVKIKLGNNPLPVVDQDVIENITDRDILLCWIRVTYRDIIFYKKLKR